MNIVKMVISFSDKSSAWYESGDDEADWAYNTEQVNYIIKQAKMILENRKYLYLRGLYEMLGLNALSVDADLGWEVGIYDNFNPMITYVKENNQILIGISAAHLRGDI